MTRLLVIGPLGPPLGGIQGIMDMQVHSSLAREFELHVVATSKGRLRWAVENPTLRTPLYFVRDFSRLVRTLLRVRPDAALVHTAAGLSFLRDWVFMVTARLAGAKVICHYHRPLHTPFPSPHPRTRPATCRPLLSPAKPT